MLVKFHRFLLHCLYLLVEQESGLEHRLPGLESWLCHLLRVGPLASYLPSLGLGFLVYQMRTIITLPCVRTKWINTYKPLKHGSIRKCCTMLASQTCHLCLSSHDNNIWWPYHSYCYFASVAFWPNDPSSKFLSVWCWCPLC